MQARVTKKAPLQFAVYLVGRSQPRYKEVLRGMARSRENDTVLQLNGITKNFGKNRVLKGVDLTLRSGEILGLLGANGAGKSTLIKILSGVYTDFGGNMESGDTQLTVDSPLAAKQQGIQTVHQRIDEGIVPGLTVAENLVFEEISEGRLPAVRSLRQIMPRARQVAASLDLNWSDSLLRKDVAELGIADRQLLLLARALVRNPKVLILDEPTSALSQVESERLFEVIERLRATGVAVVYVSHRLGEVNSLADRIVVLREGQICAEQNAPFDWHKAVLDMLGEQVVVQLDALEERRGTEVALELQQVRLLRHAEPIDLKFRSGEVTGVVGLLGAGKTELAGGIFGARPFELGQMRLFDKPFAPARPAEAIKDGVYLVPEDRTDEAMLPGWSIAHTVSLPFLASLCRSGVIDSLAERRRSKRVIEQFGVVSTSLHQDVDALSGGNQQKVIVGRWFAGEPRLMMLDEPFRGVDLGARRDISTHARSVAHAGSCVVVLSSDIDEIREVADRIIVLVEGEVRVDSYTSELTRDQIVHYMSEVA